MDGEVRSNAFVTTRFESPDVLYISFVGELDEAELSAVIAELRRASDSGRPLFTLVDVAGLRSITAAARKATVQEMRGVRELGCVVVGASFHLRVLISLIAKALAFVREPPFPITFVATEPEARAWIDALRRAQEAGGRGDPP